MLTSPLIPRRVKPRGGNVTCGIRQRTPTGAGWNPTPQLRNRASPEDCRRLASLPTTCRVTRQSPGDGSTPLLDPRAMAPGSHYTRAHSSDSNLKRISSSGAPGRVYAAIPGGGSGTRRPQGRYGVLGQGLPRHPGSGLPSHTRAHHDPGGRARAC